MLSRLHHCIDFTEIWYGDTLFPEEGHRHTFYGDNQHTQRTKLVLNGTINHYVINLPDLGQVMKIFRVRWINFLSSACLV